MTARTPFEGRHYETGTIVNVLAALGALNPKTERPYSEALALGASGGVALGYFVFEYTGHLPHVALLTRNTFSAFDRMLDNLAIRRETKESTDPKKGEKNLRLELECGNPVIVWADMFSLPYKGLDPTQMWAMQPLLVVGTDGDDYLVADGPGEPMRVTSEVLATARGRVKKDRFRIMTIEPPDVGRLAEGLDRGIETCAALFLDKPPAGSANNFGITGMRHWAKMLTDKGNAKGWAKTFAPGPRLAQALAGRHGQPGVWDWIETWGTRDAGDRETYASFLRDAAAWTGRDSLEQAADLFQESAGFWRRLAIAAMPDGVALLKQQRELKKKYAGMNPSHVEERAAIRAEMAALVEELADPEVLAGAAEQIQREMATLVIEIADREEQAANLLRA